jgi:LacI family transcriptional regulator
VSADAPPTRRAPTVSDVAGRAGVSPKTVSRALNNEGNVRPDKVDRVRRAAEELGFRPNEFARLLRTRGTTSMVGVVTASVGDPFWTGVLQGVESVIGGSERFILSASTRDRSDRESEIVAAMVERRVMALLVVPTAVDQSYLGAIVAGGTPVVCLDRPAVGADIDAVVADDVGGVRRGMDLLIRRGHRRIAFLGTGSIYTTAQRVEGYREALATAGIDYDEALVHAEFNETSPVDPAVDALLALDAPPSAVFVANVNTSIGLLSGLRQRHWSPAIVAFSDFDAARIHNPTVTVVDNDPVELGRRGAELALERLDGYAGAARLVCIDTPIIERESHLVGLS